MATRGNGVDRGAFLGDAVVEIGFLPLKGCLLAGVLFASCIVMVARDRRSGFCLSKKKENMRSEFCLYVRVRKREESASFTFFGLVMI